MDQQKFEELEERVATSDATDAEQTYRDAMDSGALTEKQQTKLTEHYKRREINLEDDGD